MPIASSSTPSSAPAPTIAIVGAGRMGRALARALSEAGATVLGPTGRGVAPAPADVTLICVPDQDIASVAGGLSRGHLVGHCSASTPLDVLAPHERLLLHPLMTATSSGARFEGAACAVDGSSDHALEMAERIGVLMGMRPVRIAHDDRALYHAAAVLASGAIVTLAGTATRVAAMVGIDRASLAPLARAAIDNWDAHGARAALTGPIARGDERTVARLRDALGERAIDVLPVWDVLADALRALPIEPAGSTAPELRIVRSVSELRRVLRIERGHGRRIGFVPTMGALHEGHLSLMRRAREDCDVVVASLFVNPTQFNDPSDLAAYPRDEAGDARLVQSAGVDILFAPEAAEVYPAGFASTVEVHGLTDVLEGAARGSGHFRGVTTVVAKLLNMVQPDVAYFGQKDAQQALVVRRMVRDLDIDTRIETCPIVRDADGLAMSSRNVRLMSDDRSRATALSACLFAIAGAYSGGERSVARLEAVGRAVLARRGIMDAAVDYLALVDADTLLPVDAVERRTLVAIAAHIGPVRLIDNVILEP